MLAYIPAQAARPMVVDDATISGAGDCQLESWTQRTSGQTEYWAVPACNVGEKWEFAAGLGNIDPDGPEGTFRSGFVQAKTVFRPMETNGWGVGLTIANQFRLGTGPAGDLSVLVPVSLSLLDDRILMHANIGWLHARAHRRTDQFWAVGAEWAVQPKMALTLEAYGTRRGHGFTQAGARLTLVPDRLAVDAGVGSRIGRLGMERFFTFGLTLAGPVLRQTGDAGRGPQSMQSR